MESCQCLPVLHVRVAHSRQINSNSSSSNSSAARDRSCLFAQGTCTQCTRGEMVYTHSATNLGILIVITFPGDLNAHASRHALDSLLHADQHRQNAIVVVVVVVVDRTETRVYINITTHALASTLSVSTSCTFHTQSLPLTTSFMLSSTSSLSLSLCVCVCTQHTVSLTPRTLDHTALFSLTSRRTSDVFISFAANFRIAFTAFGARSLNVKCLLCKRRPRLIVYTLVTVSLERSRFPMAPLSLVLSLPSFFSKSMRSIKEP